jgi:hypothetical protein
MKFKGTPMEPATKRIKLPFWKTVADSYRWGFGRLPEVVVRFWSVLLALTIVSLGLYWLVHPYETEAGSLGSGWISIIFIPFIGGIFTAMIAVPWHSLVLNDEPLAGQGLTFDTRVLSYATWGMAVMMPFLASFPLFTNAIPADLPTGATDDTNAALATISFNMLAAAMVALIAGIYIFARLGIKVVATALRDPNGSLGVIWQNTSWSFWRLFWGPIITCLPMIAAIWLLPDVAFVPDGGTPPSRFSYAATNAAVGLVCTVFGLAPLTFLSLAYRHFMMSPAERTAP